MGLIWLAIGNEILSGRTSDTNLSIFCRAFNTSFSKAFVIPDDIEAIKQAFKEANNYNMVVVCGGLGPTTDDLTLEAFLSYSGLESNFKREYLNIEQDRILTPALVKQAIIPVGFSAIKNKVGTAPLIFGEFKKTYWFFLPGVPEEFQSFCYNLEFREFFLKLLQKSQNTTSIFVMFQREVDVYTAIKDVIHGFAKNVGFYPKYGTVEIVITEDDDKLNFLIEAIEFKFKEKGFEYLISNSPLEKLVFNKLIEKNLSIACAESITGGLLARIITKNPGSSKIFKGSIVSYSLQSKKEILGLYKIINPVTAETAIDMAKRVKEIFKADVGLSTTGVAGPGSDEFNNPEGLAYCGISLGDKLETHEFRFSGSRESNINKTAICSLYKLYKLLEKL